MSEEVVIEAGLSLLERELSELFPQLEASAYGEAVKTVYRAATSPPIIFTLIINPISGQFHVTNSPNLSELPTDLIVAIADTFSNLSQRIITDRLKSESQPAPVVEVEEEDEIAE